MKQFQRGPVARAVSAALTGSLFATAMAVPALAQDIEDDAATIDEITVTARKRQELLIEVPMNIAVIGAAEISSRNLITKEDVYRSVAGAAAPGVGGDNQRGELILRGLSGSNDSTPDTSSVFTDGVPFEFDDLYDVERIEVLRGPQGTLYGSNAIGGTVQIITKKPVLDEFQMNGSLLFRDENNRPGTETRAYGMVNLPIIDGQLALRVSGSSGSRDGKILNINTDHRGVETEQFLRAQLGWVPNDRTRVNFSYVWEDYHSTEFQDVDTSAPPYYYEAILTPNDEATYGYDVELAWPDCPTGASRPECKTSYLGSLVKDYDPDFAVWNLVDPEDANETSLFGLSVERDDLINDVDLFYAGSYRDYSVTGRQWQWSRYDAQDMFRTWIDDVDGYKRWTHELRLQSAGDRALSWTVGAFYDSEKWKPNDSVQWQYHASDNRSRAIADYLWGYYWGYEDPTQLGIDLYGNGNVHYNGSQVRWENLEVAFFGEVNYMFDLGDAGRIEVTGGLRHYDLSNDYLYIDSGLWNNATTEVDDGEDGVRGKFSLNYIPNESMAVFGIYSEGYRPGGNNGPSTPVSCRNDPAVGDYVDRYQSDEIENYELGMKGFAFNRRMQFSSAIYQIDWTGVQADVYMDTCGFTYTANAATARSRGFEFESTTSLTDSLNLIVNYASTESKMTSDVPTIGAEAGDDMTMVPKYNFYVALDKDFFVRGRDANVRLDVAGYGEFKTHFNVRPEDIAPAYELVNLSVGLDITEDASINLHINNLLDDRILRYRRSRSRNTVSYWTVHHEYYAPDRTVAIRLDYNF
ncbi:MAG: TonB-dependent receptor [Gammaproteobacteria bacterium]|jgi:outer membrane receptor protein involved in Fe transport|nr:TonB-dependent receptor [Gammaproteobacteria bacterium]MDH3820195.1 TonB-dependent receptor [Gammaproteobacteria bacterium]